ncbi:MAG: hypothetical protein CMC33_01690 [Flavobacteriaceae bacterium]|nr:hypothetical protein [Flavobacteriaceae bacterium]
MKILVSGENSQLGKEFSKLTFNCKKHSFLFTNSNSMNFFNKENIKETIINFNPDIIVNFSAYTMVDMAEENKLDCYEINSNIPGFIASISNKIGAYFIHISSDYVFGDPSNAPFDSNAATHPVNAYGVSKLSGEKKIINNSSSSLVIRTSSLFGVHNHNFVKLIAKKILKKESLQIINDQKISMTYSFDLAKFILSIISKKNLDFILKEKKNRIIHYTNTGYATWYELACHVKDSIDSNYDKIIPIETKDWKSKAKRPSDSRLIIDYGIFESLNIELYSWKDRVSMVVRELI